MAIPTSEIAVGSAIIATLSLSIAAYMAFGTRPQLAPEAESESINPQLQVPGEFAETIARIRVRNTHL